MAQYDAILNVGGQFDERGFESKLQQSLSRVEKNVKFSAFSGASRNVRDFNSELDRANQRVITLGASFAVLSTSIRVFKDIISSTVAVEKALTDINSVFQLSTKSMDTFAKGLFNVARETSQSFEKTAEAAKEFSRQGLGATEVLKRTRDAMVLTRLASLDAEEAVSTLTASINGFQRAALDSTQIVNKLATVDAAFAVSSKDLAQGLARAGAAASDAGVSFDQLIGLITSAQQTTARGGSVIGNSLKTIFTRVERKDTIEAFEALGVAVTDLQGNMLPAISLLQNFSSVYDKLGGTVKKQAAELVGGVYQINILKALLGDLAKGSDSVATRAANTSAQAADEAIKRNEALNKSLAALLQQSQTTYQQIGAKVGDLGIAGAAKGALSGFNSSSFVRAFAEAGDSDTNSMGERAAAGFIKGFGNAVVFGLGPSLLIALGKITGSVFGKVQRDFADLVGANKISKDQAVIQEQIVGLYNAGDSALKRQLLTMGSLAERAAMVEGILARSANMQGAVSGELGSLAGAVMGIRKVPRAAGGYDPFSAESAAIRAGVGGAHPSARPVMIKNFAYGGGVTGPIVANTSEWMVKKGGGSAIYNPAMIQKMGLPPGATPIAAGGYIPNMAGGGSPDYSSPDYYRNLGFGGKSFGSPFGAAPGSYTSGPTSSGSASGQGFGQFLKYAAAPVSSGYDEAMKAKQAASLAAEQMAADFIKSQKELDKQRILEEKITKLKERQFDAEQKKTADKEARYAKRAEKDIAKQTKINDMQREAEAINLAKRYELLEPIVQKVRQKSQAQAAVDAIPEEKKAVWLTGLPRGEYDVRQERIKSGWAKFEIEEKLRQSVPYFNRTPPEKYFKRDFKDLTRKDLESSSGMWGVSSNVSDRFEASQAARGAAFRPVVGVRAVNYQQLTDALQASRGAAHGSTIAEQFNTTVQDLMKSGKGMNTAYNAAIAEIMKETSNRAQINKIIRESIPVNVALEKVMAERFEAVMTKNKQNRVAVNLQAAQNQIGAALATGGFGALDPRQRSIYLATIRREEAQKLGFQNGNVGGNALAQSQIDQAVNQRVSQAFQMVPDVLKGGKKESFFSRNPLAAQLALSMGLPMLGGALPSFFSESQRLGGTGMGMGIGAASSALTFAGSGAAIGSFMGPGGTAIGAGIGAAIGAISGALGKLTMSFEDASREINNINSKTRLQYDAVMSVSRISSDITQLEASGGQGTREMKALYKARAEAMGVIEDPKLRRYMTGSMADRQKGETMQQEEMRRRSIGGDIFSSFAGALEMDRVGLDDSIKATSRVSSSLVPFFQNMKPDQLSSYSQKIQQDPLGTIQDIMIKSGISPDQVNRMMPGSFNPNNPVARNLAWGGGMDAIAKARALQRDEGLGSASRKAESDRMRGLLGLSEGYRQEAEFGKITASANQSIFSVGQGIGMANPRLTELDKIKLQGYYGRSAAERDYTNEGAIQISGVKSNLLTALGKSGADNDVVRSRISSLGGIGGFEKLLDDIRTLGEKTPSEIAKSGLSAVGTPEFQKILEEAIRSQMTLGKSYREQTRAVDENTKALEDDYRLRNSRVGGTEFYSGQIERATEALKNAEERNDTPDVIQSLKTALDLAKVGAAYQAGGSENKYYAGVLKSRLSNERTTGEFDTAAIRSLARNPATRHLVSGSMLQSAEFGEANRAGMDGKSVESLYGGFKSGFAKMKQDFANLAELGANLGQSLSSNLSGAFGDFVTGAKTGKDAFRSFAVSVLNDASRMFASQAIQGILGSIFGGIGNTASVGIGQIKTLANGGPVGFAAGGKVPAMLTGGEYYIGPNAAKKIGYDTLHRINGYADGGMVRGGSGMKDDVPARLAPGSFIIKKSAVNKLGPDYLDSLVNGKVQHRFFGGLLMGALMGGALGYATGGKKGAIAGALIGGIGGGLAQNMSQTGHLFQSGSDAGMFQFSSSAAAPSGAPMEIGYGEYGAAPSAVAAKVPMGWGAKLGLGLGAAALLGGASRLLTPKDPTFTPMTSAQISANRAALEREQSATSAPAGLFPWLSANQNGGQNLMGYVPPTRRLYANGGMVGGSSGTPLMFSEGGAVPGGSVDSASTAPMSSSRSGGAASVNVKIEINNNGTTSSSATSSNKDGQGGFGADFAQKLQKQVQGIVQQELVNQSRSDGFFAQKGRFIQR